MLKDSGMGVLYVSIQDLCSLGTKHGAGHGAARASVHGIVHSIWSYYRSLGLYLVH